MSLTNWAVTLKTESMIARISPSLALGPCSLSPIHQKRCQPTLGIPSLHPVTGCDSWEEGVPEWTPFSSSKQDLPCASRDPGCLPQLIGPCCSAFSIRPGLFFLCTSGALASPVAISTNVPWSRATYSYI